MKCLLLLVLLTSVALGRPLPQNCSQLVLGIADNWNSSSATLQRFHRTPTGWAPSSTPFKTRLGKNGLAWGQGAHTIPPGAPFIKKEGDRRAPAGSFPIGGAFGYDSSVKKHPKLFYRKITPNDLWVEDVSSRSYNQHIILNHAPKTPWEKKQQMRQGDYAHSLKLFIAHNPPPQAKPGAGSAIFFHIWRGNGSKATFGCTTMPETRLREMIAWIDPTRAPHYILLPRSVYTAVRADWQLPELTQ